MSALGVATIVLQVGLIALVAVSLFFTLEDAGAFRRWWRR